MGLKLLRVWGTSCQQERTAVCEAEESDNHARKLDSSRPSCLGLEELEPPWAWVCHSLQMSRQVGDKIHQLPLCLTTFMDLQNTQAAASLRPHKPHRTSSLSALTWQRPEERSPACLRRHRAEPPATSSGHPEGSLRRVLFSHILPGCLCPPGGGDGAGF